MVGVFWKGKGGEVERIDDGFSQQLKARCNGLEDRKVMGQYIVPQDHFRMPTEDIEAGKGLADFKGPFPFKGRLTVDSPDSVDAAGFGLKVQEKTPSQKGVKVLMSRTFHYA
jgi:hypothetical protein